jgi:Zn-dependent protease
MNEMIALLLLAQMNLPDLSPQSLVKGLVMYLVFLFSTTCHEAAHALAAKLGGDPTAYHGGQVSLSPVPHIRREPIGMVVVPIASYLLRNSLMGWASAPYDPDWGYRFPRRAAWMALAGPAANFALMLMAAVAIRFGLAHGYFEAPDRANIAQVTVLAATGQASFLTTLLSVMFALNLLLGVFNLIPVPPLDGSGGIMLFMSQDTARRYSAFVHEGGFAMLGILAAWYLSKYILDPAFTFALNLLYPGMRYG